MPKVSVVLPNYNYARFLDERFRSFLNQTFSDFELIVVDDGSTDGSLEVIRRYAGDPRITTRLFAANGGSVCRRWNDGARMARGEYLLFALSDDSCEPRMLETLVAALDAHPSAGLAYCQSWIIDAEGRRLHSGKDWHDALDPAHWASDHVNGGADELRRYLFLTCTIPCPSAVMMRRQLFVDVGGLDKLRLVADWKLWAQILARSDVAFAAAPLCLFRTHPATVRQAAIRDLMFLEENYLIKSLIAELVDVPEETRSSRGSPSTDADFSPASRAGV
jgi:glycosyltransferase involved in cell wall biosynthesis